MLLKCAGIILVILTCGMFGFSLSYDYLERLANLTQTNKMLLLLRGEISHNNSGIMEAMNSVAVQTNNIMSGFLEYVSDSFSKGKTTLNQAWDMGVDEYLKSKSKLDEKDMLIIKELGTNLGITDRETQINNITKCMDVIDFTICELNETRGEKCRLYKTLGIMSGAFLAIVLI